MQRRFLSTPLLVLSAMVTTPTGATTAFGGPELIARYCPTERVDDALGRLENEINVATWDGLPETISPQTFNATARKALDLAYDGNAEATGVHPDALADSFERTRAYVRYRLQRESEIFTDLPDAGATTIQELDGRLAAAKLMEAPQWVEEMVSNHRDPGATGGWDVARTRSYIDFHRHCGGNGLNARPYMPHQSPLDSTDVLMTCPGLSVGMHDVLGKEGDHLIVEAYAYSYGLQLGEIISAHLDNYWTGQDPAQQDAHRHRHPSTYKPGYWGAIALAERMADRSPDDRHKLALLALDTHCRELSNEQRPETVKDFLSDLLAMPALGNMLNHRESAPIEVK